MGPVRAEAAFSAIVTRMEPLIESECLAIRRIANCDFQIGIDRTPGEAPNAFQTIDRTGRPVILFTSSLLADARNEDELAFILGHEAAHHIAQHLPRQEQNATAGALLLGALIGAAGGDGAAVDTAQRVGAVVGARQYSKDFELEADQLGTVLAWRAGYDPERGAAFFTRIPEPGNGFLGTHPPNGQRIATVRATLAGLR